VAPVADVLAPADLEGLDGCAIKPVRAHRAALDALERSPAAQRRSVCDVIDRSQEDAVRRYRTAEATVDGLLP
jgi:hypothetical protein